MAASTRVESTPASAWLAQDTYRVRIRLTTDLLGTQPKDPSVWETHKAKLFIDQQLAAAKKAEATGELVLLADGTEATPESLRARADEEKAAIGLSDEKSYTGFFTDPKDPHQWFLLDYQIKGFLKAAAAVVKGWGTGPGDKQLASRITKFVFLVQKRILLPKQDRFGIYDGQRRDGTILTGTEELPETDRPLIQWDSQVERFICSRSIRAKTAMGERTALTKSDVILSGAELTFDLRVLRIGGIPGECLEAVLSYGMFQGLGQWRSGGWGTFETLECRKIASDPGRQPTGAVAKAGKKGSATPDDDGAGDEE